MYSYYFKQLTIVFLTIFLLCTSLDAKSASFKLTPYSDPLDRAWAITWLPDGSMIVTERAGKLKHLSILGSIISEISGLPNIATVGEGGLLDVQLHPNYISNHRVYLCFSQSTAAKGYVTAVGYGILEGNNLLNFKTIFSANAGGNSVYHFGCRIRFSDESRLFVAIGERGNSMWSQDPSIHAGSILALTDEGLPHPNNPNLPNWQPEIYAIGVRNPQGLVWIQNENKLFLHEHGPMGGDEINLIKAGANYGWPIITYGEEYGGGKIGEGTHKKGMEQPLLYWTPSIAPSGFLYYTGTAFPDWRYSFFIGSLKFKKLLRIERQGGILTNQQIIIQQAPGRVRDVAQGPDGYIYILIDGNNSPVYRLTPY